MLVSFIVPVYNNSKYLVEAVDSIKAQQVDHEIILIDDGSTDGSSALCDSIAEKDPCVRVIHTPNGGVSRARNLGIEQATGDYLLFLDSDDVLICDVFDEAVLEKNYDALLYGMSYATPSLKPYRTLGCGNDSVLSGVDAVFKGCRMGSFLIKRKIVCENNMRFDETLKFAEDYLFCDSILAACTTVWWDSKVLVLYRQHSKSVCRTYTTRRMDPIKCRKTQIEQNKNVPKLEQLYKELYIGSIWEHIQVSYKQGISLKKICEGLESAGYYSDFLQYRSFLNKSSTLYQEIGEYFENTNRVLFKLKLKAVFSIFKKVARELLFKF